MDRERAAQLVEAGMWLQLTGDQEGARRLFEQALQLDPHNVKARELVGTTQPDPGAPPPAPHWQPMPPQPPQPSYPQAHAHAAPNAPGAGDGGWYEPVELDQVDWANATGIASGFGGTPTPAPIPRPPRQGMPQQSQPQWQPAKPQPHWQPAKPQPHWQPAPPPPPQHQPPPPPPQSRPARAAPSGWDSTSEPGVHVTQVAPGFGDAMEMVAERREEAPAVEVASDAAVKSEVRALLRGAADLLELDDHTGAMELILKAQQLAPGDPQVQKLRERSEGVLLTMFESKLGPMSARPRVVLKDDEIIWLNFDHRAGFVLAQIDGTVRFEDLFEVCGMSRFDTARILAQLVDEGVISTR